MLTAEIAAKGRATLALSGGTTPRAVYVLLGSEPFRSAIPWRNVHCFWGDERCVPPENPESNYRMVRESLLDRIAIPSGNIHRIAGELPPEQAAAQYEAELHSYFGSPSAGNMQFDLILLGLGDDGHTASIFPGTNAESEQQKIVVAVSPRTVPQPRVTLTLPVLNQAKQILFLVSGERKAAIVKEILEGEEGRYPSQKVHPVAGDVRWLLDADAASLLQQ
jgi:6-phosphogluconolactonase